jgi:hypothetical protein
LHWLARAIAQGLRIEQGRGFDEIKRITRGAIATGLGYPIAGIGGTGQALHFGYSITDPACFQCIAGAIQPISRRGAG